MISWAYKFTVYEALVNLLWQISSKNIYSGPLYNNPEDKQL